MSENTKSGGASPISAPKGGGALRGIGEKFSPDLHTGTGNFTVPIALPPARNGFQPDVSLAYSTGQGNGPFGLGWALSIPGVSRATAKGVPLYDDSRDTFVISGAEDLVPVAGAPPGTTRFRPRTEGLFARIDHHRDARSDFWEVRSKDGLMSFYGTPERAGADPAVIADPSHPAKVFAWKLTRTTDPFGNRIDYLYERDPIRAEGPHHWDQLYLKQIRYTDYGDPAAPDFLVTVRFTYEERPDRFSEYRAGFEVRTVRRCTRIDVTTHPGADVPNRTYHLDYLDRQRLAPEELPPNGISLLHQIRVDGHDGSRSESLPPLTFAYTRFEPRRRDFLSVAGSDLPPGSLARAEYELVDLFGNGLPDVLEMNDTVRYWRNRGEGRFDLPREMGQAPAGLDLADPSVQIVDANGDGRADLLVTAEVANGYYPLRFGGLWDRRSFQRYRQAPSFDLKDPEVRLVDLDGDGVTDAIRSGTRLELFFNDPTEGWNGTRRVERRALDAFPNVNFSDPRLKWADMSGDGLQDIVLLHDGNVEYWPSLGRGNWGRRVSMRNSPRFPHGYAPTRILVGDVDGDGLADLVYVDDMKVTLWINRSGDRWSDPIEIEGTPPVSDIGAVRLTDLLGTGVSGVLWSADADELPGAAMFFLDLTGGTKPYLLCEMDNHLGAVTRVGYAPSTRFYIEDQKRPETRWKTPLPFPVQVVSRVEAIDAISGGKLTTEYRYHHGYWDGAEREFRGFGRVDQHDTEVFEDFNAQGLHTERPFETVDRRSFSPPLETRTWFHQGPIGDEFGDWDETDFRDEFWSEDPQTLSRPRAIRDVLRALPRRARRDALRVLRGRVLRTEFYALDGTSRQDRPYTVSENLHGVREEAAPGPAEPDRQRIFFPHALASRTTQWERGEDPMTQFSFVADYDEVGQPRQQTAVALPRRATKRNAVVGIGVDVVDPNETRILATHTRTDYARPTGDAYLHDRVAQVRTFELTTPPEVSESAPDDLAQVLADHADAAQSIHDGFRALLDSLPLGADVPAGLRLLGQTLHFYDGPAFQGLPFGRVGIHGALVRTETLVLTEEVLHGAYKSAPRLSTPPERPPYLVPGGTPAWTPDYPPAFRELLPVSETVDSTRPGLTITPVGYGFAAGGAGSPFARGYFVASDRRRYDFQQSVSGNGRGLVMTTRDPLGRETSVAYDLFDLLPTAVTDPAGLISRAAYDYRVFQPRLVTDANGNRTAYTFTPLGLLRSTAVVGRPDEAVGDTLAVPGARLVYDLHAFTERGQPISVRTMRRVHHVNDGEVALPERDETIESVEYSDGFGRLVQTRAQAEDVLFGDPLFGGAVLPADQSDTAGTRREIRGRRRADPDPPNVVVSGWQVYDNKGRMVEKYQPFFSTGYAYAPPTDAQRGQKTVMHYDPRGHVLRATSPDGSEQRVIYGVPGRIDAPDLSSLHVFEPTPWETYTYDEDDNAGRTHSSTARHYAHQWDTPSSTIVDALGRTVLAVERNRRRLPDGAWSPVEAHLTRSAYDIAGNVLTVTDAVGRTAFRYVYDLANRPLRIDSIDAGLRRSVLDASGNALEARDGRGALVLHAHDVLGRPIRLWARDGKGEGVTLRERLEYGDGGDPHQSMSAREANRSLNRLGRLVTHYDEAGRLTVDRYDLKGNVLEKARQVINDAAILAPFRPPPREWNVPAFRVDWQPPSGTTLMSHAGALLDGTVYQTSLAYDALNRVKLLRYPRDVEGKRRELRPQYSRAGALERLTLDGEVYVHHIAYTAKGQRVLVVYGNGIMTRHVYDERAFRLLRLRTERYSEPGTLTYRPKGASLQDFGYAYDVAGNLLALHDRTPGSGLPAQPDRLDRAFNYDPLYRLISATGRECDAPTPSPPWRDQPRCTDLTRTRAYTERYEYDPAGNLVELSHRAEGGSFTRELALTPGSNRLGALNVGSTPHAFVYDASGNLIRENTARLLEWDHSDRLRVFRVQTAGAEPSLHVHYLYAAGGQRVKKLVRKQGGRLEVTIYVDGIFEHQRIISGGTAEENNTLHVMDNASRVATIRLGTAFPDDTTPAVKYHLADHLGNSSAALDHTGSQISQEEYTPYGETSFGSFVRKRYRFSGKERDEESGLYYHGARYYVPWLGRWASCDPSGMVDAVNLFVYAGNAPTRFIDPTGRNYIAPTNTGDNDRPLIKRTHSAEPSRVPQLEADPSIIPLDPLVVSAFTLGAAKKPPSAKPAAQAASATSLSLPDLLGIPSLKLGMAYPDQPKPANSRGSLGLLGIPSLRLGMAYPDSTGTARSSESPTKVVSERQGDATPRGPWITVDDVGDVANLLTTGLTLLDMFNRAYPGRLPTSITGPLPKVGTGVGYIGLGLSLFKLGTANTTERRVEGVGDTVASVVGFLGPIGSAFSGGYAAGAWWDTKVVGRYETTKRASMWLGAFVWHGFAEFGLGSPDTGATARGATRE